MRQLGVGCQDSVSNVAELSDVADLQKTFSYYFKNGASAGSVVAGGCQCFCHCFCIYFMQPSSVCGVSKNTLFVLANNIAKLLTSVDTLWSSLVAIKCESSHFYLLSHVTIHRLWKLTC